MDPLEQVALTGPVPLALFMSYPWHVKNTFVIVFFQQCKSASNSKGILCKKIRRNGHRLKRVVKYSVRPKQ